MQQQSILIPMFALVGLTFLVWARMYHVRIRYIVRNRIDVDNYKSRSGYADVPTEVMSASDNLINLFEAPVLFYAAILTIFLTGSADPAFQLMAWGYVGLRVAHTAVHITYNKVLHRFSAYFLSSLVLWAIWLRLTYILFG
jgi:hypothetical protein